MDRQNMGERLVDRQIADWLRRGAGLGYGVAAQMALAMAAGLDGVAEPMGGADALRALAGILRRAAEERETRERRG